MERLKLFMVGLSYTILLRHVSFYEALKIVFAYKWLKRKMNSTFKHRSKTCIDVFFLPQHFPDITFTHQRIIENYFY